MKNFLIEYFQEYKPKNIKASLTYGTNNGNLSLAPIIIISGLIGGNLANIQNTSNVILFLSVNIPALLIAFSIMLHRVEREKIFFLLPLDRAERQEKIRGDYQKRIIIHFLLFLIGIILIEIFYKPKISLLLLMTLMDFIFSTLVFFMKGLKGIVEEIVLVGAFVIINVWIMLLMMYPNHGLWQEIILYIIFFTMVLPTFISHQKSIKLKLSGASEYGGGIQ